jgi:hypothetical protein
MMLEEPTNMLEVGKKDADEVAKQSTLADETNRNS